MTLYTVGYQKFRSPADLRAKLDSLSIEILVDVRSVPASRKPGFDQHGLAGEFGERYRWMGDVLGGRAPIQAEGIAELRRLSRCRKVVVLCAEHDPLRCHRYTAICGPNFPSALHILGDEILSARDLDRREQVQRELPGLGR